MNRYLQFSICIITLFITLLTCSQAYSKGIVIGNKGTKLSLVNDSRTKLSFVNTVGSIKVNSISTTRRGFSELIINGYIKNGKVGYPAVPVKKQLIEIPYGAISSIKIKSFEFEEFSLSDYGSDLPLIPTQPSLSKQEDFAKFIINEDIYKSEDYIFNELVEIEDLGYMRSTHLAVIKISPIQYNPSSNTIKVFSKIEFEIINSNCDFKKEKELKAQTASPYFSGLTGNMIINKTRTENITNYPVKYVIISPRIFEETLKPFIQWKTEKGFNVITGYTDMPEVGTSKESIKSYLQSLYINSTAKDPAPSFVLFVGDINLIPTYEEQYIELKHPSDKEYVEFTGDMIPDMFFGRFSAQNIEHCQTYVEKTIMYEKCSMPDPSYLENALLVSGVDETNAIIECNGQIKYAARNYVNKEHGINATTYLYPSSGEDNVAGEIIDIISNGVSYSNYTAHCKPEGWNDPKFQNNDVFSLTNKDKYCVIIGNCCKSSKFDINESFSEKITRTKDKGAVAYIGASDLSYWEEDFHFSVGLSTPSAEPPPTYEGSGFGFYDRLFHDHGEEFSDWYITTSQIIFAGNLSVSTSETQKKRYYWNIYNVIGDPSLMIHMGIPTDINVSHNNIIPEGQIEYEVITEPYAYIALSQDGKLISSCLAAKSGRGKLNIDNIKLGKAKVVVTAQNRKPYISEVDVSAPPGPFISLKEITIDDSQGNNNGKVDYGEVIRLNMTLKNYGNLASGNLNVQIQSEDDNITINKASQNWGQINIGASNTKLSAFEFKVKDGVENGSGAVIKINIKDADQSWENKHVIKLNAPKLELSEIEIKESNYNKSWDPGERAIVNIKLLNKGGASAKDITTSISSENNLVIIPKFSIKTNQLEPNESKTLSFNVELSHNAKIKDNEKLIFNAKAKSYIAKYKKEFIIGIFTETFKNGFDPAWEFEGSANWKITKEYSHSEQFSAVSGRISNNQTSDLIRNILVKSDGEISFYLKTSAEDKYDGLKFFIDNEEKEFWAGKNDWTKVSFPITKGSHILKWSYIKDIEDSGREDRVFIDHITFPPLKSLGTQKTAIPISSVNIFPNPSPKNWVKISYNALESGNVKITLINSFSQVVKILENKIINQGNHSIQFNSQDLASGIYHCVISINNKRITTKLIVQ
ncbi:MAG: C25 family cysteine peptidase [Hyphomicrobiales bacterium]